MKDQACVLFRVCQAMRIFKGEALKWCARQPNEGGQEGSAEREWGKHEQ